MADSLQPTPIRLAEAADLPRLADAWHELYRLQKEGGMRLDVPADGFERWSASLASTLGRFTCLVLAEEGPGAAPAGFVAGRVRTAPPWLGGEPLGFISEVYVASSHRGQGLGERLLEGACDWFRGQKIHRLELQVLSSNSGAHRLYQRLGWRDELVQMVTTLDP